MVLDINVQPRTKMLKCRARGLGAINICSFIERSHIAAKMFKAISCNFCSRTVLMAKLQPFVRELPLDIAGLLRQETGATTILKQNQLIPVYIRGLNENIKYPLKAPMSGGSQMAGLLRSHSPS
jgi:hypothetical protein